MQKQIGSGSVVKSTYEWAEAVAFAVVTVVLVFTFLLRIMSVDGISMEPTLRHSDYVAVSNLFYTPKNGDIVVIAPTESLDIPVIKRVIATQGQVVDIDFEAGVVSVNGVVLHEVYIAEPTHASSDVVFPQTVPAGRVFVLGDNRDSSLDSRNSSVGMVDTRYILGRVLLRLLPFSSFGPV